MFLALLLDLGHGIVGGAEPGHGLSFLVHHELGEVPLDRVHQEAALLGLNQVLGVGHFHSQWTYDSFAHVQGNKMPRLLQQNSLMLGPDFLDN